MNDKNNNEKILIVTILGAFISFLIVNWLIEQVIQKPFTNDINLKNQKFNSPPNIIFLISAAILILTSTIKLIIKCKSSCNSFNGDQIQDDEEQQYENQIIKDPKFDNKIKQQTHKSGNRKDNQDQNLKFQLLFYFKVALPKFVQILCFLYGIGYLGFPTMVFINILAKLGLGMLYEIIFKSHQSKKCLKVFIVMLVFLSYGCFHYTLNQINDKKSDEQLIYGYLFASGMCIVSIIRQILSKFQLSIHQNYSAIDQVMLQAKFNFVSAYLLTVYLKQEIYGLVFGVIHYEFIIKILLLSFLLFTGILLKTFLKRQFNHELSQFMVILQKNVSVFISFSYFSVGVQTTIIFALFIMSFSSLVNLLLKLYSGTQNSKTPFAQQKSFKSDKKSHNNNFKNNDMNLNDQRNRLKA